ncbi:hypothetical protein [Paenibacillus sp. LHD-38]|uniref:hypothetical protein n=1 Tax=Paenibacillus sp. LHD-38 TaxID=3072143 RepID=UPI00280E6CB3|nr:hypothetical protein [Paenibacillus sp. LHD-38]MDQ8736879.1 hypothetical protein [Paenibacillus sp. LHD-38]
MKKLFEIMLYGGLTGFIIMRIFFYDYKGIMLASALIALLGLIGGKVIRSRKTSNYNQ